MRFTLSTLAQPYILAAFIYAGILVGALFSIFRLIRRAFGGGKAVTIVTDVLFLLSSCALVVFIMYSVVSMRLRLYYLVGIVIGFLLYGAAIFPIVRYIEKKFIKKNVDKKGKSDCNNK